MTGIPGIAVKTGIKGRGLWLRFFVLFLATGISLISSCGKEYSEENGAGSASQGTLTLSFQHTVKNFILNFDDQYTTDFGETYRVSSFKYYLHNITLVSGPETAALL